MGDHVRRTDQLRKDLVLFKARCGHFLTLLESLQSGWTGEPVQMGLDQNVVGDDQAAVPFFPDILKVAWPFVVDFKAR